MRIELLCFEVDEIFVIFKYLSIGEASAKPKTIKNIEENMPLNFLGSIFSYRVLVS
jgi:hypothetical protein